MDLLTFLTLLDEHPEAVLSLASVGSGRLGYAHARCLKEWSGEEMQRLHGVGVVANFAERYAAEVAPKRYESVKCICCGEYIRWTS
jgi:hypothetical protein